MAIMEATELERLRKYAQVKSPRYNSDMRASGLRGGGGEMEWDHATGTSGEMEWDEREWDEIEFF